MNRENNAADRTTADQDAVASTMSEMLLYHAALGRGYTTPFPAPRSVTVTSALNYRALDALNLAESKFREWHETQLAADRKELEQLEATPAMNKIMGNGRRISELKEKLGRMPYVTWQEDLTSKSTMVDLLKRSYYGASTYVDPIGARMAMTLTGHNSWLARDMSWLTLTRGTADSAFIRAHGTGGSSIHSLSGRDVSFGYVCSCDEDIIDALENRVRKSLSGRPAVGSVFSVRGSDSFFTGTSSETLFTLMRKVYALGADDKQRLFVRADVESSDGWDEMLKWDAAALLGRDGEMNSAERKIVRNAPASPETCVRTAIRAVTVMAFVQQAEKGDVGDVTLTVKHLMLAQQFARMVFTASSGIAGLDKRQANLRTGAENYLSEDRLTEGLIAFEEHVAAAENGRLSRWQIRSIPGLTYGVLDELVRRGMVAELRGTENCKMGRATRAYEIPSASQQAAPEEAMAEFGQAADQFAADSGGFSESEAIAAYESLQRKAEAMFGEEMLPAVPLSRMSAWELRNLPVVLDMFEGAVVLRGTGTEFPEPERLVDDEESPLDRDGMNLWIAHRTNGRSFVQDWSKVPGLDLERHFQQAADVRSSREEAA